MASNDQETRPPIEALRERPDDEETAREFVRLLYDLRASTFETTRWLGVRARKLPTDLWSLQEIVFETRPDLIVESGVYEGGTTLFFATILDLLGHGEVIGIDHNLSRVEERVRSHPRVSLIEGSSVEDGVVTRIADASSGSRVMVDLDSDHSAGHVFEELQRLAGFVTPGCYLLVEDTILNGNPVAEESGPGPAEAIARWMESNPPFEVDPHRERFRATLNPGGYLRRLGEEQAQPPADPPVALPADPERELVGLRMTLDQHRRDAAELRASMAVASRQERRRSADARRRRAYGEALEAKVEDLERRLSEKHEEIDQLNGAIWERNRELEKVGLRLARIQGSLPMRAIRRFRWLPPFRWVFARRSREYWRQVEAERKKNG